MKRIGLTALATSVVVTSALSVHSAAPTSGAAARSPSASAAAATEQPPPAPDQAQLLTLSALGDEVERAQASLRLPGFPEPHYLAANVLDHDHVFVNATLGQAVSDSQRRSRLLQTEVRVGTAEFDSSGFMGAESPLSTQEVPYEHNYEALRRELWLALDSAFKGAVSTYEAKRGQRLTQTAQEKPADFTPARASRWLSGAPVPELPRARYMKLARAVSEVFRAYPDIQESGVSIMAATERRYFASSEGSQVIEPSALMEISIWARAQADDGMALAHFASFCSVTPDILPADAELLAAARRVADELTLLRKAPVVENYGGPVLFEAMSAPQLLRVLLSEEFSGTPPPEAPGGPLLESSYLSSRVGWKVLPPDVSVVDDPTLTELHGSPLIGGYHYDDEAVPGQRVQLASGGKLLGLLMSRTPSKQFSGSNGHGRGGLSGYVRARPSNLIFDSNAGLSPARLRAKLLQAAREEGLKYAMIVRQLDEPRLTGGVLEQERVPANSGPVLPRPILIYRLGLDGKEQLVRGATLQSINARDLRYMLGVGARKSAFGYFAPSTVLPSVGAYAGDIPTSIVSPELLVRDIDVRRPTAPHKRPPLLTAPTSSR